MIHEADNKIIAIALDKLDEANKKISQLTSKNEEMREALELASEILHNDPNDERDPHLDMVCKKCREALGIEEDCKPVDVRFELLQIQERIDLR